MRGGGGGGRRGGGRVNMFWGCARTRCRGRFGFAQDWMCTVQRMDGLSEGKALASKAVEWRRRGRGARWRQGCAGLRCGLCVLGWGILMVASTVDGTFVACIVRIQLRSTQYNLYCAEQACPTKKFHEFLWYIQCTSTTTTPYCSSGTIHIRVIDSCPY
jgi:hypothetical protein